MLKVYLFLTLTLIQLAAHSNPYDRFGEASAQYVGTCYALEYLRTNYCPTITLHLPELCVNAVVSFTPSKFKSSMQDLLTNEKNEFIKNSKIGIDKGFQKTIVMMNGDKEKSCIGYGASLATLNNQLYEELKRIQGDLK